MTPEDLAKTGSEAGHQEALFCWAALAKKQYPDLEYLYHVPNGDSRGGDKRSAMIVGARLKAQGVKSGIPDLAMDAARRGYHGIRIEMKKPGLQKTKNGGCSDAQVKQLSRLHSEGYAVFVAYSWTDAKNILIWYLT